MVRFIIHTLLLGVLLLDSTWSAMAQQRSSGSRERTPRQELVYDNITYLPVIRSVQWHPADEEAGLPVLTLGQPGSLQLVFDDLRGDIRNFYYSIEHCTADWQSSHLSPLEYAEGYNEDRVMQYQSSVNTLQPYTQYSLEVPSQQVRPKIAGNYLLKVYEDADKRRLILTRRFYVVQPLFTVAAELVPSMQTASRSHNQKINLTLHTGTQRVNNPFQQIQILIMQNQRPDVQQWLRQPSMVQEGSLQYRDPSTFDFAAGNEFRYIDLRSFRLASDRIASLKTDSLVKIELFPDANHADLAYASTFDENGAFFIRNQDRPDALEEADYALVHFQLDPKEMAARLTADATIYVVGAFNQYRREEENRLRYHEPSSTWEVSLLLKQGLYDYEYVWMDETSDALKPFAFSGSHFQTENTYQILVYFRRPGTTWDEIAAFHVLRSTK